MNRSRKVAIELGAGLGLPLTATEIRVIRSVLAGAVTRNKIGQALRLGPKMVSWHLHNIYIKTGAINLVHLVLMIGGFVAKPENLIGVEDD